MDSDTALLFIGIVLLVLSAFPAYFMVVSDEYYVWGLRFIFMLGGGLLSLLIGLLVLSGRARAQFANEQERIKRERQERERASLLQRARNLEEARNFEASALIYERLGMFREAGRVRKQSQVVKVTRTEVSVNLNSLLQQLRDGGIAVVYRCPNCKAPLKISRDTKVESLQVCEHCGSEIEAVDVADFLRTALS